MTHPSPAKPPRLGGRLAVVSSVLFLLGCLLYHLGATASEPVILEQADGATFRLSRPARRIITLAPHLTELAFAAGAGNLVVATVEYSDYPEDAQSIQRVGDAFRLDLEQIVMLKPDLVMAWESGNPRAAVERLRSLGLPVWTIEVRQPGQIVETLLAIGRATARLDTAASVAGDLEQRLLTLENRYQGRPGLAYFYQVAERPLFTVNGHHLISQMLAKCGGVNVFAAEPGLAQQVSHESVVVADPDVLIAPQVSADDRPLRQWLEWPSMRAVNRTALIHIPADEISRATPRMVRAIEAACQELDGLRTTGRASQGLKESR